MKHIVWNIVPTALPEVVRHCSKCGGEGAFACSGKFRVNAQRRSLDIWLIYRCRACDTTWNARVYQHISPQSLSGDLLRRFTENDENLAREYALDCEFLRSNGAKVCPPHYDIEGDAFDPDEPIELGIRNECGLALRVSNVVRAKLHMSQSEYSRRVDAGLIAPAQAGDLKKCRLAGGIILRFACGCEG